MTPMKMVKFWIYIYFLSFLSARGQVAASNPISLFWKKWKKEYK
jgi:hypothetical protein